MTATAEDLAALALRVDSYRSAITLAQALAVGDSETVLAVLTAAPVPQQVALASACLTVRICQQGGLDAAAIQGLLAAVGADGTDFMLFEPAGGSSAEAR